MDKDERYYNIKRLNRLFAFTSIVLLISLIALFVDDYSREWKKYQQRFRKLEVEKTRKSIEEETGNLKNKAEYQALLKKIDDAKKAFESKAAERKPLEVELEKLSAKNDINQQNYQFTKAQLDSARYAYEDAVAHQASDAAAKKKNLGVLEEKIHELRLALEDSKTVVVHQTTKLQEFSKMVKQLEKDKNALTKQLDILERKLKKIDEKEMTFASKLANSVRDFPIVDFMNPNYKVDQIVIKDITDDVNFMRVPKVDRCTTCHAGVVKPGFENAPEPFRTHPKLDLFLSSNSAHPLEEFGCTTCHGGRGRGVDFYSAAHTPSTQQQREAWEKKYHWKKFEFTETPMLPLKYTEAGCFKCHSGETVIKGAEKLNLGLNIVEKAGCFGCHNIDRYKKWPKIGPDLTHLSSKTTKDWVYRWVKDPRSFRHNTWMPSFFGQSNNNDPESQKRSEQEIIAIVNYLFNNSSEFKKEELAVKGDPKRGEELVVSIGCLGCHEIQPTKKEPQPTTLHGLRREHGPNLIGLGSKTTEQWLYNWLKDPKRYHSESRMPNLRLSDEEAADIATYLTSTNNDPQFMKESIPLVNEKILNDIAGDFLTKMTTIEDAKKQIAEMPLEQKLSFVGKKLIKHYGCFACHNISGFENEKPIGTDLTEEGSKSPHRLDFGFVDIEHNNYDWFEQKLKNPRIFDKDRVRVADEKLKMPNFHFTDDQIEAVITVLLGFVKDKPAPSKMMPRTPRQLYIEEGQRIIREFNCQGCHIMGGEGGAIQPAITEWLIKYQNRGEADAKAVTTSFSPPNLIGEGEKVQTEWLFNFIHNPEVIRPWLKARMPTFGFANEDTNSIVRYFSYLDQQDFPFTEKVEPHLTPDEQQAGEKLFSNNYFGCGQCHMVGSKMPTGSQDSWAPNFAMAKTRLKPEWIVKWLKNPQALLPGTKMPTFFDPANFDTSGPDDILGGDENKQIKVLRDYLLTITNSTPESKKEEPAQVSSQNAPAENGVPSAAQQPSPTQPQAQPQTETNPASH